MEKFELKKTRDFGELINDTFVFVKHIWKPLIKSYLAIGGFFLVATLVLSVLQQSKMSGLLNDMKTGGYRSNPYRMYDATYFLSMFFSIFNYVVIGLVVFCFISVYNEKDGEEPTIEEVWGYCKYYALRFTGSSILLGILVVFATMLCFFPGVYMWPIISLIMAVMIFENASLNYSFRRAFTLIKDNWWTTFGAMFIIVLVAYGLCMVVIVPTMGITMGKMLFGGLKQISMPVIILITILQSLVHVFLLLPYIVVSLSYFSLSETKDGAGLMARIETLGQGPKTDLPEEEY